MAEAQLKEEARSVGELTRLIKGELAAAEVVAKVNYSRVGEYLTALKPQVGARRWKGYLRDQFDLSETHASRYAKFYKQTQEFLAGLRTRKPTHLNDVDPPRRNPADQNHAKGFGAWRASQQQGTRTRWDTESAKADRPREQSLGLELIEAGYRLLVQKYHPDKGGDDVNFRCLTNARARLRRCLLA